MNSHEHLKTLIEDIYLNDNNVTEDQFLRLVNELRYSTLYIPAKRDDGTLNFIIYEVEGRKMTPLFTDMDEYRKFYRDEDLKVLDNTFELYRNVIKTSEIEGYILNPASQNYILDEDLIMSIKHFPKGQFSPDDAYSKEEISSIYENIDNSSLNEFISKRENVGYYAGLFEEFSKSTLLTLMLSASGLESDGGVIDMSSTGPVAFMHIDRVGGKYATVYSDTSKMLDVNVDGNLYRYAQIVNTSTLVDYILSMDLDGLILNPDTDNVLIPRGELLKNSYGFEKFCNDSRLMSAIFYIFDIK